ncbi:hypothetical protein HDU76_004666 [Blyttiomyces sp. JEL0837]|nr:hypothetical protein HDU76_004666 [Blyttiomyces sp. JEL0837]
MYKSCLPYIDGLNQSAVMYRRIQVWYEGLEAWVWDFGARSASYNGSNTVRINPMYFPYYELSNKPAGRPILSSIPCKSDYSDAVLKIKVYLPEGTKMDYYTDHETLQNAVLGNTNIEGIYNIPVIETGSSLEGDRLSLFAGWYNKSIPLGHGIIDYASFGSDSFYTKHYVNESTFPEDFYTSYDDVLPLVKTSTTDNLIYNYPISYIRSKPAG